MKLTFADFDVFHAAVHGPRTKPFSWQTRLLAEVVAKRAWPRVLDLPTGVGKTTCLDIALFALALDAQEAPANRWCPRRIAMVVDRRVVVDQVAERGRKLQRALLQSDADPVVLEVARRLRELSKEGDAPLDVFALRGGMPRDDGWARSPDQPLILASTVDQLGSRLLLQGYGVSPGMRPVHAGLLGNDLLLLLDEVHLSQPFAETLDALDRLRKRFARSSLTPRFHHAFLSATPSLSSSETFRLHDDERARASPLGARLYAPKPTRLLLDFDGRAALEAGCADEACKLIERHEVVAVVVNRVKSALNLANALRDRLQGLAEVTLVTGRMRPLDRDDVMAQIRPRIATGRNRVLAGKKLIVVGTQCIEAGADFDFDAIVTEAASLDALRQRFGRVDRIGEYGKAEGVILRDKTVKTDPVYGDAIGATIVWLKEHLSKKSKEVDFGVLALPVPSDERAVEVTTPKAHSPVLLPAYLDLWMQTSPAPEIVPDVSLWLHGPKSGPADVQVLWRADLSDKHLVEAYGAAAGDSRKDLPTAVVAAIRPSSLESISLPFVVAKQWLSGVEVGEFADVEGVGIIDRERGASQLALRWRGDESTVIEAANLRPGDTIVVPTSRGGICAGCFDPLSTDRVHDLAERSALFSAGRPMLRLHPDVLAQLDLSLPIDDSRESRRILGALAVQADPISWRKLWLESLAKSLGSLVVDAPEPWVVLRGRKLSPNALRSLVSVEATAEDGAEATTDEDESFHADRPVGLADHSADVEHFARVYSEGLLPANLASDLALAGWLHDIGKADRRFQIMLRGGSEVELYKDETPLAKSGMRPGASAAHRLAQKRSGYPTGARHEVQSLAMIENHIGALKSMASDLDLVLHLISSHHGYCRPFAPVVIDDMPVDVVLPDHSSQQFGVIGFPATTSKHELHRLDAPLGDRFWSLVERYGWLELCWLEAILRLADHRASEEEQMGGEQR